MAVSKPLPGTQIDPASPWARGLVLSTPCNEGGGARVTNYAPALNGNSGVGTALQNVGSPLGGDLKFNGSTSVVDFGSAARMSGTGKFALAFRMNVRSLPADGQNHFIYSTGYNGTQLNLFLGFQNAFFLGKLIIGVDANGATGYTTRDFTQAANQNKWFDVYVEYNGGTVCSIKIDGVVDYSTAGLGTRTRQSGFSKATLGCIDLTGTKTAFTSVELDYFYHFENRTLSDVEYASLRANPWQLWPDDQIVFAPESGTTGTATSSQAQTADATGLAGAIGTASASQAQSTAGTGLAGAIGAATSAQAQSAAATGLAGNIGSATSAQAQTTDATGGDVSVGTAATSQGQTTAGAGTTGAIGSAASAQAQTSSATGLVGAIGSADTAQAQTIDAVAAVDVVGAITMGQAQSTAATGYNGSVPQTAGGKPPPGIQWVPAHVPQRLKRTRRMRDNDILFLGQ